MKKRQFKRPMLMRVLGAHKYFRLLEKFHTFRGDFNEFMRRCRRCGSWRGVKSEHSMTAYAWDGKGRDPNQNIRLCRDCAKDHHEHWDSMWDEYYASRG